MLHFPLKSRDIENWDDFKKEGVVDVSKVTEISSVLILVQRNIKKKKGLSFFFLIVVYYKGIIISVDKGHFIQ